MAVPHGVVSLVRKFEENRAAYQSGAFNETSTRVQFINPLFRELGWDVDNASGAPEAYKDVVHEDAVKVGAYTKAPDYSFRVGGARRFFLEAKKPSVNLHDDVNPAFQLRRYAWSAKLPVSLLTDFEEMAVYDCRREPVKTDAAHVARDRYYRFDEYAEKWDEIAGLFSKNAVLAGSLDKYADAAGRGSKSLVTVDAAFLREMNGWREWLAHDLAARNPRLSARELNFAVQMTIDRVVFLRICEDRGTEPPGKLQGVQNGPNVYARLCHLFREADERYNSGLFHFSPEAGRTDGPDALTLTLNVGDETLRTILSRLYPPDSPYAFAVIPIEILGQVYEQFLGKVIRVEDGTAAKNADRRTVVIEEKPEVRKAGGVYYTPTYIVEYIVRETVGKLVAGKNPKQVAALRICDPACGSGSFLIGAYQFLLDWHRDWYLDETNGGAKKHKKELYQGPGGEWRLTTEVRKRVLLNNIFGVDIDTQAVEVTKLSLLLCVLSGETAETVHSSLALFHQRALPSLENNVKCGNSLIGPDFYDKQQMAFFDEDALYRINVFDWKAAFPAVFKGDAPGFDAVIGNPPYLSYSGRQAVELSHPERDYLFSTYENSGWPTAHSFFLEKGVQSLSARYVSMIVPDQVGHLAGYEGVREMIATRAPLVEVHYWGEKVFANVVTPALTFVADKAHRGPTTIREENGTVAQMDVSDGAPWSAIANKDFITKVAQRGASLGSLVADPGVHTGNVSGKIILKRADSTADSVPVLEGKQVTRYACNEPEKVLRLGYKPQEGEYFTVRPKEKYAAAQFVIRQTAAYPIVGPREGATFFRNSLLALYSPSDGRDVRFIVGVLNSALMRYLYTTSVREAQQKAFPQVKVAALRALPVRPIDFDDASDKARHDKVVALVEKMLDLHKRHKAARTPQETNLLAGQIAATDRQIDALVYELYGLTSDEIALVEATAANTHPGL